MRASLDASHTRITPPTTAPSVATVPETRRSSTSVSQSSASSKRSPSPKRSSSRSPTHATHKAQRQQLPAPPGRAGRYALNTSQQPQVATTASQKARVVLLWLRTFQVGNGPNRNAALPKSRTIGTRFRGTGDQPTNAGHTVGAHVSQLPSNPAAEQACSICRACFVLYSWHGACGIQVLTGAITSGATGYQFYSSVIVRNALDSDVNWVRLRRGFQYDGESKWSGPQVLRQECQP
jgi:hypothetical protein